MKIRLLLAAFLLLCGLGRAEAACTVPYTFVQQTLAQSGQVNANFNAILSCLNNAANPVATYAALTALPSTYATFVTRQSFAVAGDAPPLLYYNSGSPCVRNAGAGDKGQQVPSSDGKCWIGVLPFEFPATEFGFDSTGATATSTAVNNAIIAANSVGGGVITISGTPKVDATYFMLTGVALQGTGMGSTVLEPTGNFDVIRIGGTSLIGQGERVSDMSCLRSGTVSGGACVHIEGAGSSKVENFNCTNTWDCIDMGGSAEILVDHVTGVGTRANGSNIGLLLFESVSVPGGLPTIPTDNVISNSWFSGPVVAGVPAGWLEALQVNAGETIQFPNDYFGAAADNSVQLLSGVSAGLGRASSVLNVFFPGTYIDASANGGVFISGATGDCDHGIFDVHLEGANIQASGGGSGDGIGVDGTSRGGGGCAFPQALHGLFLAGTLVKAWPHNGINLQGGVGIDLSGVSIWGNNYANAGAYNGLNIGANVKKISVTGSNIGGDPFGNTSGGTNLQRYGITIASGASEVNLQSNNLCGNVTAGLLDSSAATGDRSYANNKCAAALLMTSYVEFGAAISYPSTGVAQNVTSLTLGPGDWLVWGAAGVAPAATTTVSLVTASLSLTTNTNGANHDALMTTTVSNTGNVLQYPLSPMQVTVATGATTPVYLVEQITFGVDTMKVFGFIKAQQR